MVFFLVGVTYIITVLARGARGTTGTHGTLEEKGGEEVRITRIRKKEGEGWRWKEEVRKTQMGMENPHICIESTGRGDTCRSSRLARLTGRALETLGTLEDKERGVGLEGQVPANFFPSHQEIPIPCPNPPSQRPKPKVMYKDILDTHRCTRGARKTTRTRRTLRKKKKGDH